MTAATQASSYISPFPEWGKDANIILCKTREMFYQGNIWCPSKNDEIMINN